VLESVFEDQEVFAGVGQLMREPSIDNAFALAIIVGGGLLALVGSCAAPAISFAGSATARAIALQRATVEDPFNKGLFAIFAVGNVAIMLLGAGLMWAVLGTRLQRLAVDRIVSNLDEAPAGRTDGG
jgi:hypothetical protein